MILYKTKTRIITLQNVLGEYKNHLGEDAKTAIKHIFPNIYLH